MEPQWHDVITTLRHQLTQAKHEADATLSELAAVKKYVLSYPDCNDAIVVSGLRSCDHGKK